ncbi:TonB family protein [Teredinibacter turnerae]|uniref:TonB family protein n=1 Tax=Teredinibacter turnerae TaxID=2426 RepID=UPI00037F1C1D|nr:TonB family protein [Teredinibacter turnerae]
MRIPTIPKSLILLAMLLLAGKTLAAPALNGLSIHTELGKEQFIAALLVASPSTNGRDILINNEPKQIQVRIVAPRVSSRSFKRMWIEGMAINSSSSELSENAEAMARFSNLLKIKLMEGDIFTIDRGTDAVTIYLNSVKLGEINSVAFFDLLLRTLIGPVPLSSQFRDGLLVAGDIDAGLLARFDATVPTEDRIAAVKTAVSNQEQPAPKVATEEPQVTLAPVAVAPAVTSPGVVATKPVVTPDLASAEPAESTPTPAPVTKPSPSPKPTPKPTVKPTPAPQQALLDADAVEEEEDDLDFTAESLLQQQLYIAQLKRHTYKYLHYPKRALDRGWEGNVRLNITINRFGKVQDIIVVEESEYKTLTKEAEKAAERASPFPAMPEDLRGETFAFTLPVVFKIRSE